MISRRFRPDRRRPRLLTWRAGELQARHLAVIATGVLLMLAMAISALSPGSSSVGPTGPRSAQGAITQIQIVPAPGPAAAKTIREADSLSRPEQVADREAPEAVMDSTDAATQPAAAASEPKRLSVEQELARILDRQTQTASADFSATLEEPPLLVLDGVAGARGRTADFQRALFDHIKRYRRYPEAAFADRLQGVVKLVFTMNRDGTLLEARVVDSSGSALLDQSALDMIWRADPLPSVPSDLPDHLRITLPVEFSAAP